MNKRMVGLIIIVLLLLLGLAACGGDQEGTGGAGGDAASGEKLYVSSCAACHGPGGTGVPGLGTDLTTSEFVANQSDSELVAFIKEGRPPDHPDNTTGVAMPPKGANPSLTDEDLSSIVAYIRSIHQ
jgi:disulfide bond formation protein DsbB